MIIKCPNCGRRFDLQRRPPVTFTCPKCSFTVPFSVVMKEQSSQISADITNSEVNIPESNSTGINTPSSADVDIKTKVVQQPLGDSNLETRVVAGMNIGGAPAAPKVQKAVLQMMFNGQPFGTVTLPTGNYELGRKSSDSTAKVKLTPDMSMSRVHAGMRTVQMNGRMAYQITSIKNENPVIVNGIPIARGKACTLKNGDQIIMGTTMMVFKLM